MARKRERMRCRASSKVSLLMLFSAAIVIVRYYMHALDSLPILSASDAHPTTSVAAASVTSPAAPLNGAPGACEGAGVLANANANANANACPSFSPCYDRNAAAVAAAAAAATSGAAQRPPAQCRCQTENKPDGSAGPVQSVVLLKTHKTASSTLSCILGSYALRHDLTVFNPYFHDHLTGWRSYKNWYSPAFIDAASDGGSDSSAGGGTCKVAYHTEFDFTKHGYEVDLRTHTYDFYLWQ
jgi:hypothetical protein